MHINPSTQKAHFPSFCLSKVAILYVHSSVKPSLISQPIIISFYANIYYILYYSFNICTLFCIKFYEINNLMTPTGTWCQRNSLALPLFSFLSRHPYLEIPTNLSILFPCLQTNDNSGSAVILNISLISTSPTFLRLSTIVTTRSVL